MNSGSQDVWKERELAAEKAYILQKQAKQFGTGKQETGKTDGEGQFESRAEQILKKHGINNQVVLTELCALFRDCTGSQ